MQVHPDNYGNNHIKMFSKDIRTLQQAKYLMRVMAANTQVENEAGICASTIDGLQVICERYGKQYLDEQGNYQEQQKAKQLVDESIPESNSFST